MKPNEISEKEFLQFYKCPAYTFGKLVSRKQGLWGKSTDKGVVYYSI